MRKLTACLFLVLIASINAVSISKTGMSSGNQKMLGDLKNSKTGAIILDLAQLLTATSGPVDDLVDAVQELISELSEGIEDAQQKWSDRTSDHEQTVATEQNNINNANTDISQTTNQLDNVLFPQKQQLEHTIAQLQTDSANNRQQKADEIQQRQQEKELYEQTVDEHEQAISALDEALEVVTVLQSQGTATTLVQTQSFKQKINKVQAALKKNNIQSTIAKALLSLNSNQLFANKEQTEKIRSMLTQIRENFVSWLEKENNEEQQSIADFTQSQAELENAYNNLQNQLTDNQLSLKLTNESIQENQDFLQLRKDDLVRFTQSLERENANYAQEQEIYNTFIQESTTELAVANNGFNVLKNSEVAAYIRDRVNAAGVSATL